MEFVSENLVLILCGLAGFGLLIGEAFMPGIGVAGILGVILEVIAIYSAWLHHGFQFALILTLILIAVIGLTVYLTYRSALKGRLSRSALVLNDAEAPGTEAEDKLAACQGREGVAVSALRPGGTVEVDGVRVNAASGGELIAKGAKILVVGREGDHVIGRPAG